MYVALAQRRDVRKAQLEQQYTQVCPLFLQRKLLPTVNRFPSCGPLPEACLQMAM